MIHAGLILEGGAVRGVFTAGALDYLVECKIEFSHVIGVSAGSCNAVDYVARQKGRTKACFIPEDKVNQCMSLKNVFLGKSLYDMEKAFVEYPSEIYPFDFKSFFASPTTCEIVATNCLTGEPNYFQTKRERATLMKYCRASSSLPLVSSMVQVDGIPYLDGGLSDSVPIRHSIEAGNRKNVIILTRNPGYRKSSSTRLNHLYEKKYAQYPNLIHTIEHRARMYNKTMAYIEHMERKGEVFVLRPTIPCPSKIETHADVLNAFYEHGYHKMRKELDKMMDYLYAKA